MISGSDLDSILAPCLLQLSIPFSDPVFACVFFRLALTSGALNPPEPAFHYSKKRIYGKPPSEDEFGMHF